jgi:IclR family transcriptional regulator, acetate operon repressor
MTVQHRALQDGSVPDGSVRDGARSEGGGTLEKGLAIVRFVGERPDVTAGAIMDAFGLSRSATYRLLDRLRTGGYLQEGAAPGSFRLGPRMVVIGLAALNQMDLMHVAPPLLGPLAQAAGETVNLAVPQGDEMVYVYQHDGPGSVKVTARLGTRRPMNCTSLGKAYLAHLPEEELEERLRTLAYVRLTPRSLTTADALRPELQLTRRRGYAVDDVEVEDGVSCVGAPILDYRGRPVAALSIAGPAERMPDKRPTVVPLLLQTATAVSTRLGYLT